MKNAKIKTALAFCFLALLCCCNAEKQNNEYGIKVYKKTSNQPIKRRTPKMQTKKDSIFWDSIYQYEKDNHDYSDDFVPW